jgi:hypothetical protein
MLNDFQVLNVWKKDKVPKRVSYMRKNKETLKFTSERLGERR